MAAPAPKMGPIGYGLMSMFLTFDLRRVPANSGKLWASPA